MVKRAGQSWGLHKCLVCVGTCLQARVNDFKMVELLTSNKFVIKKMEGTILRWLIGGRTTIEHIVKILQRFHRPL